MTHPPSEFNESAAADIEHGCLAVGRADGRHDDREALVFQLLSESGDSQVVEQPVFLAESQLGPDASHSVTVQPDSFHPFQQLLCQGRLARLTLAPYPENHEPHLI